MKRLGKQGSLKFSSLIAATVFCLDLRRNINTLAVRQKMVNVNVICLPTKHQRALGTRSKGVCAFQVELEFRNVGFHGRRKTSLQNRRYFFAFFRRTRANARRVQSARHARREGREKNNARVSRTSRSPRVCPRSPEKRKKKLENPKKNPRSRDGNQQQTQPTYDAKSGNRTRATLVGAAR